MQSESSAVTTEDLLEAVADPRRRDLLEHLRGREGGAVTVDRLADELCGRGAFHDDPDRLRVRLQHVHLPKLAATGVLSFDGRSGTARYCGDERVAKLLAFVDAELE
jgi:hypothetical protein